MVGVLTLEGQRVQLDLLVGRGRPESLVLKLWVNDTEPSPDDRADQYVEPRDPGYRPRVLTGEQWTQDEDGGRSYPVQVFTFGGSLRVAGYFLVRERSGTLVAAESFAGGPFDIRAGDQIKVHPMIGW